MILETHRLLLKTVTIGNENEILRYQNENKNFLETFEPKRTDIFYTLEHQRESLELEISRRENGTEYKFYIYKKECSNEIIGSVSISNIVRGAFLSCFLGYKLSEKNTNNGYMTEAINAIIYYAFQELKLHRIEANVMPKNKASLAVLKKCNFINEGLSSQYLKINGVWEDHIHMVLINKEV